MVTKDGQTLNPFDYLTGIDYENCSGSTCGSGDGDAFNPRGNWNWPINPKIRFTQGYGYTWAVQHTWVGRIYRFHNGIDLQSPSLEVKAIKPGTLYAGSYVGSCVLKYVRVHHDEGNIDTYYLHVNY
jgi:murein DD-endopeptidase MepM/ murein hydrolase activator NlpD